MCIKRWFVGHWYLRSDSDDLLTVYRLDRVARSLPQANVIITHSAASSFDLMGIDT